ncbi:metallopeptidase family protein [Bifidobacterium vespertilionis]|uniref:Metallopeptidase family protein n=1 Tax=Bifidobacterium vespertilionis TaxID=2562524 RepID=A0A5J5DXM3_9BIFI|nr:metallopeptidase family protein [Bifidobacterium vespertilionis]KAA8821644.1 metallopeptidase family protein [Bifidobacterium vespertilionis]KAA8824724.1 metallopeptidase family protein [Bifidobacterium vespertilionis]
MRITSPKPPWMGGVYRNRHGRGPRRPMFGTRLPRYRTRSGMFDDLVASQLKRLGQAWPELLKPVQFAVEDVPPSDPLPWEDEPRLLSKVFPAEHGIPPRIVLYRLPIQMQTRDRTELQFIIRDELVSCIAEHYGRRPEEIDPDWGL